jgi:hypothetical protein
MKKIVIFICLLLCLIVHVSAQKEDNNWLLGYLPNIQDKKYGGTQIRFQDTLREVTFFDIPFDFSAITVMNDAVGNLLFYSNGCEIINAQHQIMLGGDSINAGVVYNGHCEYGYPCHNCIMALPDPANAQMFYLFHLRNGMVFRFPNFLFSKIDMSLDGGMGAVIQKNQTILDDGFTDYLTATRHGNGRDWWIIIHQYRSNTHYVFLLDPNGIHGPFTQRIGPAYNMYDWSGQSVFSPDGTKFVRSNPFNGVTIFDFERCTGQLSNPRTLLLDSIYVCGAAFSHNSRFLYLSTGLKLYQLDMQAADVFDSKILIGEYDGFMGPFATTFYHQRLAPDRKIYITATNGVNYLHIIHNPDLLGKACNFEQHGLELATYHAYATPNIPYYRLWDAAGSPCDTLGINGPISSTNVTFLPSFQSLTISPSPASEQVFFSVPDLADWQEPFQLTISDLTGHVLFNNRWSGGGFSIANYPSGLYIGILRSTNGRCWGGRFTKI